MKLAEKDQIMGDFAAGIIDILVSTTVVEVGVNVPNATIMVIMNAENYGLAQLHQLRGRVGRGSEKSYCYLIVDGDKEPSKRLKELEKSTDGFYLAEKDLEIRGPGEIYGSLQHGALNLKIATLADTKLISAASKRAEDFAKNPENMVKYKELAKNIKKYQQLTTLN
jgi:ATP-dependent DNA helicase RecG